MKRQAFTLIELLVAIAIIAILIGVLLPALGAARRSARTTVCGATQHSIGQALSLYNNDHKELVVPSFNMEGIDTTLPLDGWAPILERDAYMTGSRTVKGGPFVCPETIDVAGMANGQTGADPNNPKGWMDWPNLRTGSQNSPILIPERGFDEILRVSYWINAFNPIGGSVAIFDNLHYSVSVGYGPGANGITATANRLSAFVRPYQLIATADGIYAGRHRDNRIGTTNSRIGYRHPGRGGGAVNAAFADGHLSIIHADEFPSATGGALSLDEVRAQNLNGRPSIYANPEKALAP